MLKTVVGVVIFATVALTIIFNGSNSLKMNHEFQEGGGSNAPAEAPSAQPSAAH